MSQKYLFKYLIPENAPLHHALLDGDEEAFKAHLVPSEINRIVSVKNITPLHLAALLGCEKRAILLLEAGALIDCQDALGYTALHFAAFTSSSLYDELKKRGSRVDLQNCYKGRAEDLFALVHPSEGTFFFNQEEKMADCFRSLAKAELFLTKSMASREALLKDWLDPILIKWQEEKVDLAFSPLSLEPHPKTGLTVRALADIEPGTLIAEYAGEYVRDIKTVKASCPFRYSTKHFYAETKRGLAAMIDHSFPNAELIGFKNVEGLPARVYIRALDLIKKGEILGFNYGRSFQYTDYVELRPEAVQEFAHVIAKSGSSIADFFNQSIESWDRSSEKSFEERSCYKKVMYLLNTPLSLMLLALSHDAFGPSDVLDVYCLVTKRVWVPDNPSYAQIMTAYCLALKKWCEQSKASLNRDVIRHICEEGSLTKLIEFFKAR